MTIMAVSAHDRAEWLRMAGAVEARGATSLAAGLRRAAAEAELPAKAFDAWKEAYRVWLVFGDLPGVCNCDRCRAKAVRS